MLSPDQLPCDCPTGPQKHLAVCANYRHQPVYPEIATEAAKQGAAAYHYERPRPWERNDEA